MYIQSGEIAFYTYALILIYIANNTLNTALKTLVLSYLLRPKARIIKKTLPVAIAIHIIKEVGKNNGPTDSKYCPISHGIVIPPELAPMKNQLVNRPDPATNRSR